MSSTPKGNDPTLWSASQQAAAIAARELGSEELLDLCLDRIELLDPLLHAVCTLDVHRARRRANEADAATMRGERWGPLHGLPFTIKDAIDTAGIRSTGGAEALRDRIATSDAPAVASLRSAGAIVFGKTNLPEWSGDWQSFNTMFGTTNNPWDLARTPGGSSGGAAAAVACGMTSAELGTDIGGSVRVPSAFCGVFGHKPSFGVVPTLGYIDEPNGGGTESDVNTFGPIARSVDDLRLLLDVLAGPSPADAAAWSLRLPTDDGLTLDRLRVGVWFDEPALEIDRDMATVLHAAADALEAAGASVDRERRPSIDVEASWRLGARLIGAAVALHAAEPAALTHQEWLRMHRQREQLRAAWAECFAHVDVMLCPVTLVPAFEHLQSGAWCDRMLTINGRARRYVELEGWPALVGGAYLPSTSVPVGRTAAGLPVGVQVVAPYLHDLRALKVAGWLSDTGGGFSPPPIARSVIPGGASH
jgi:amidase